MKLFLSKSVLFKWFMNVYPPYLFTGISLKEISNNFRSLKVIMPLRWYNRNYVGTHFGGNLFSMTDPWLMLMLIENLGRDFKVIDHSASIEFIKLGKSCMSCDFYIDDDLLQRIYQRTEHGDKYLLEFTVDIKNELNEVVAKVKKLFI